MGFALGQDRRPEHCSEGLVAVGSAHSQRLPNALRTDDSAELTTAKISSLLSNNGITHQITADESLKSNGMAKRASRKLTAMTRAMLMDSSSELFMWAEAIKQADWLKNRLYNRVVKDYPLTLLFGKKTDLSHVRPFKTQAQVRPYGWVEGVPAGFPQEATIVGMDEVNQSAYRCIDPENEWPLLTTEEVTFLPPQFLRAPWLSYKPEDYATLFDPEDSGASEDSD